MNSPKTSIAAILSAISAVCLAGVAIFDGDPATVVNVEALMVSVTAAITAAGFWFSRDHDVSDERAGARKY